MPAPPPVKTVRQILDELNGVGINTPWIELNDLHALISAKVSANKLNFDLGQGLVVKLFINLNDAQIRIYLAKALDVAERDSL